MKKLSWQVIPKAGSLNNLKYVEQELRTPVESEVQIKIHSIGLNFADIFAITGLYSATPEGSFVPGLEYAGQIVKVGKSVTSWKAGDRVMGVTRFGAYTSHINMDPRYLRKIPEQWSYEEGAAYLVQGLTAWYALFSLGNLQSGQTVLIHSAAGGVGLLANRFAKKMDAFTIGSVGSSDKLDLLYREGYNKGIVRSNSFDSDLSKALESRELNLVLECIGGRIFRSSYEAMAPAGRMITYGSASFGTGKSRPNYLKLAWKYLTRPKIDPLNMISENKAIMGFNLIWLYHKIDEMESTLDDMLKVDIGKPRVGHRYNFEQIPEALRFFQTGKSTGKVVINVVRE